MTRGWGRERRQEELLGLGGGEGACQVPALTALPPAPGSLRRNATCLTLHWHCPLASQELPMLPCGSHWHPGCGPGATGAAGRRWGWGWAPATPPPPPVCGGIAQRAAWAAASSFPHLSEAMCPPTPYPPRLPAAMGRQTQATTRCPHRKPCLLSACSLRLLSWQRGEAFSTSRPWAAASQNASALEPTHNTPCCQWRPGAPPAPSRRKLTCAGLALGGVSSVACSTPAARERKGLSLEAGAEQLCWRVSFTPPPAPGPPTLQPVHQESQS